MNSNCDVVILGAGPTGLMAGVWMSRLGIKTRIIDKRGSAVYVGHADGFQTRMVEVLDSLGLLNEIKANGSAITEVCTWGPNEDNGIMRRGRPPLELYDGRMPGFTASQGYVEHSFVESIKEFGGVSIERGILPIAISVDASKAKDEDAYPVTVTLKHLKKEAAPPFQMKAHTKDEHGNYLQRAGPASVERVARTNSTAETNGDARSLANVEGTEEVVHAKYVFGCDGARSWTREQLGFKMDGEDTEAVFGVLDIVPITNFPDTRKICMIQSNAGSLLNIPREYGMVRIYVQLGEIKAGSDGLGNSRGITPSDILEAARKIFAPYALDYRYCDWWTVYQIGQRVSERYVDDAERIFLGGDAVHSHSPKGGQGMNLGMLDTFNLGWKIGGVIKGYLKRDVLATYEFERRLIAQQVIEYDQVLAAQYIGKPSPAKLEAFFQEHLLFMRGITTQYYPNLILCKDSNEGGSGGSSSSINGDHENKEGANGTMPILTKNALGVDQRLTKKLNLGMRLPPTNVRTQASGEPVNVASLLRPDGRWRLLIFAGNVAHTAQMERINALGAALRGGKEEPRGILSRYTLPQRIQPTDMNNKLPEWGSRSLHFKVGVQRERIPLLQVFTIHCGGRNAVELADFHETLFPFDPIGGHDYWTLFSDEGNPLDPETVGEMHDEFGINRDTGALVLMRPDQFIAWVGETSVEGGLKSLEEFLSAIFVELE